MQWALKAKLIYVFFTTSVPASSGFHPWTFHAFSAWWFLTDPSSSTCPTFPWVHCYIGICNTLCQKYIHGFLPTTKQIISCDLVESVSCSLRFVPSVPLLRELVNNLPPALSHHIAFWSKTSVLHSPSLLASPPLLRLKRPFCSSDMRCFILVPLWPLLFSLFERNERWGDLKCG